jgi:hypothetical protein
MSNVLTIRLAPGRLARVDRRAAQLGQDRSTYVRGLIEDDLKRGTGRPSAHVFASEDLVGCISTGIRSGDNCTVRRLIRRRLLARNATHR